MFFIFFLRLACDCSVKARNGGFKYFGIRFYGECHGGNDVEKITQYLDNGHGKSNKCINGIYTECDLKSESELCAGIEYAEYIYELMDTREKGEQESFVKFLSFY